MKKAIFYKLTAVMLLIIMMLNVFCACSIDISDWKDSWGDDSSDSVWGDGKDDVWDNTIDLAYHVNSVLLFEPEVTNEFPEIAAFTLQYDKDGEYFDDAAAKLELGSQFNLNDLAKKMAVGSGVVIVCVLLNVATAGSTVPFACFIAGAAKGALYGSVTGLASEAAMRAITTAIKTGSAVDTMYSFIEGAVDGYKWGAIFGAITGGLASEYCFAENTKVKTKFGYTNIQDIKVGDLVWSRNLRTGKNELQPVTRIFINKTDEWVRFNTANGEIICTPGHQFYDGAQYRRIDLYKTDESIASFDGNSKIVSINKQLCSNETTYNLEVENNHNYFVGKDDLLAHNSNCKNYRYAGKTYKYENTYDDYVKTGDPKLLEKYNLLIQKYPNGVPYTALDDLGRTSAEFYEYVPIGKNGLKTRKTYPDVTPENYKAGKCLKGVSNGPASSNPDFKRFWKDLVDEGYIDAADLSWWQQNYAVHHEPDMRTLSLVPKDLHEAVRHTGGGSFIREFLKSIGIDVSSWGSAVS